MLMLPKAVAVMVAEANPAASVNTTQLAAGHIPHCALPETRVNVTGIPTTGVTPSPSVIRTANGSGVPTAAVPDGDETRAIPSGATPP